LIFYQPWEERVTFNVIGGEEVSIGNKLLITFFLLMDGK